MVNVKTGPAIIDEAIAAVRKMKRKIPIQWSNVLSDSGHSKVANIANKLIDQRIITNLISSNQDILVTKAQFGFEVILMILMDDENEDRRFR